jgi:hypothetical protein
MAPQVWDLSSDARARRGRVNIDISAALRSFSLKFRKIMNPKVDAYVKEATEWKEDLGNVARDELGHLEHADLGLAAEDGLEGGIGVDHLPVLLVLETVLLDVVPELLGELRAGQRLGADDGGEGASGVTGAMNLALGLRAGFLAIVSLV